MPAAETDQLEGYTFEQQGVGSDGYITYVAGVVETEEDLSSNLFTTTIEGERC